MESYASEAEAIDEKNAANLAAGNRTLGGTVDEYLQLHRDDRGYETMRHRLRAIFQLKDGDRPLVSVTDKQAAAFYEDRAASFAPDTHHGELRYARQFFAWCIASGYLAANPFAAVKPVGKKRKGKPRLRVNATRTFLAKLHADESIEATAVLTALALGLRASTVIKRTVEDLDDDGWLLWVRDNKSAAGDLEIEVPALLRDRLLALAKGKRPTDRLFGNVTRYWLHYHTVRLCGLAEVPRVTPHGLRGSGASSAVRLGGSIGDVARALGHADDGETLKGHYLSGGSAESARGRLVEELFRGNGRDSIVPTDDSEAN
jgi:integrase